MSLELAGILSVRANQLVIEVQEAGEEALSLAGLPAGSRLLVRVSPGRLSAGPFPEPDDVQGRCRLLAEDLGDFAERVRELHARLPAVPAEEEPETEESLLRSALECVLADRLDPALRSLLEVGGVAREEQEAERLRLRGARGTFSIHGLEEADPQKMRDLAVTLFEERLASGDVWKQGQNVLGFTATGGPQGLAGFLLAYHTPGDLGLFALVTDPEARGSGLGHTLLDYAVDALRRHGLEITELVGVCMIEPQGKGA